MELKTARLTLLIDPNKKAAFERLCARQDRTPSQVVRQLIRDYLAEHEVTYVGSGVRAAEPSLPLRPAAGAKRSAPAPSPPPTGGKRRKG
ncbi:MAG: ribbon-helix-helix protein, CopG family [Burkholderiaceae bacterium]